MRIIYIISFWIIGFCTALCQVEFGTGVLLDSALYADSPIKAPLMRGDYRNLPSAYSLKLFAPTPRSQGSDGTCAGWATAYSGRTILEAISLGLKSDEIDANAFSPSYVYNQIRTVDNCRGGTSLLDALDVLKNQGCAKLVDFAYKCDKPVTDTDKEKASEHRIIEYREIANKYDGNQTLFTKKSISENKPVIIAMDTPRSFHYSGKLWKPDSTEYRYWGNGHGITVVGYDDEKYGGAFELINSWGTGWADNGFVWMRYSDYDYFTLRAYELIDIPPKNPEVPDLSGKLLFRLSSLDTMKMNFNGEYFQTKDTYYSGTLFELFLSNNQPAYVYAISSDSTNKVAKLFPFEKNMVAYLPYSSNNMAIPSEDSYNMLDDIAGKSYYCFLYSKRLLPIDEIIAKVEKSSGSFWYRLKSVLGSSLISSDKINYTYTDEIAFTAFSSDSFVVPIFIEIDHK